MHKNKKILGVTLARGGSKGIPRKNIKLLGGIPLIAHTILAARHANIFDNIIVSTDDHEIAEISRIWGADVPFMRPSELAGDTVWSRDALKHAVIECERIYNAKYDIVVELPCVSPFRTNVHICEAVQKLIDTGADSVLSVCQQYDKHPVRMKRIKDDQLFDFCSEFPEGEGSRRQDLEPCYIRNGAIYALTRDCIVEKFSRKGDISRPYVMSELESVNIDMPLDFVLAETLFQNRATL